jgi:hypothetical protein
MRINFDIGDLRRRLRKLQAAAPRLAARALVKAGAFHIRAMRDRFVPFQSGSSYGFGGFIQRRSGALGRSFNFEATPTSVAIYSAGQKYARKQELGGVITPTSRRFMTIPLPPALTPSGVLKGGARLVQRGTTSTGRPKYVTADGAPTVLFRGRSGSLIIASEGTGSRARLTPLYVLKESVRLRPRLGFEKTFREKTEPFFREELARSLKEALG